MINYMQQKNPIVSNVHWAMNVELLLRTEVTFVVKDIIVLQVLLHFNILVLQVLLEVSELD